MTKDNTEYVVFLNVCKTKYMLKEYNECGDDLLVNGQNKLWTNLSNYNDDMCCNYDESFDIVKVYVPNHPYSFTDIQYEKSERELIWSRETREVTIEELENIFKCKVKIVE